MVQPSSIAAGDLDMTLRALLTHMMEHRLDHVVLVMPDAPIRISVTVASAAKTVEITKHVQRVLCAPPT